jgi:hypothetical protein
LQLWGTAPDLLELQMAGVSLPASALSNTRAADAPFSPMARNGQPSSSTVISGGMPNLTGMMEHPKPPLTTSCRVSSRMRP